MSQQSGKFVPQEPGNDQPENRQETEVLFEPEAVRIHNMSFRCSWFYPLSALQTIFFILPYLG